MKDKIVIYREPNGIIHPISIAYGHFFVGADTIAVFQLDSQITKAIKEIKATKFNWSMISKKGKFYILPKNQTNHPIEIEPKANSVSHNETGTIRRGNITSMNGMKITDWIKNLKSKKQLGIA